MNIEIDIEIDTPKNHFKIVFICRIEIFISVCWEVYLSACIIIWIDDVEL